MASRTMFTRLILEFERDLLTWTHLKTLVESRTARTRVEQVREEIARVPTVRASKKR